MEEYIRRVQYYETDKMGFVHHSNYIRWFEEARLDFMDKTGTPYKSMEDMGLLVPVLSVNCEYKKSLHFGDSVRILTKLSDFKNVRHTFSYEVYNLKTNELCATGFTTHCFLNESGNVISLKKTNPDIFEKYEKITEN